MRIAVLLFNYAPYGGLERACLKIASVLSRRGHAIEIFTGSWEGPPPDGIEVHLLPVRGLSNRARNRSFSRAAKGALASRSFDAVVGFNKMPGLDCYYAGDSCYAAQATARHGWWYRWTQRYRIQAALERAVFSPQSRTEILSQSPQQQAVYESWYGTPSSRFHPLPPGIGRERRPPPDRRNVRAAVRRRLGLRDNDVLLLHVATSFRTKGLDRAIRAVAALPHESGSRIRLLAIGDSSSQFAALARRLDVDLTFLAPQDDLTPYYLAADFLVHPARQELTGNVILEAIIAGLPVLCTGICGFAEHVDRAGAGIVLSEPFRQNQLNQALAAMLASDQRAAWSERGLAYGDAADLYTGRERAADIIEMIAARRAAASPG